MLIWSWQLGKFRLFFLWETEYVKWLLELLNVIIYVATHSHHAGEFTYCCIYPFCFPHWVLHVILSFSYLCLTCWKPWMWAIFFGLQVWLSCSSNVQVSCLLENIDEAIVIQLIHEYGVHQLLLNCLISG